MHSIIDHQTRAISVHENCNNSRMADDCIMCKKPVTSCQQGIQCDGCLQWNHRTCNTGISQQEYRAAVRAGTGINWFCSPCRPGCPVVETSRISMTESSAEILESSEFNPRLSEFTIYHPPAQSASESMDLSADDANQNDSSFMEPLPPVLDRLRKRRRRTAFTNKQLDRLKESFERDKFPGIQIRKDLARELSIREDRIQVWFQNRRARLRKREIKNKPAPAHPASEKRQVNSHVNTSTMYQPSPAIFPPLNSAPFKPWEPFYPTFTASPLFPRRRSFASESLHRETNIRVSASASQPFSSSTSLLTSLEILYKASCGESHHSPADYLAAVILASGFQREN